MARLTAIAVFVLATLWFFFSVARASALDQVADWPSGTSVSGPGYVEDTSQGIHVHMGASSEFTRAEVRGPRVPNGSRAFYRWEQLLVPRAEVRGHPHINQMKMDKGYTGGIDLAGDSLVYNVHDKYFLHTDFDLPVGAVRWNEWQRIEIDVTWGEQGAIKIWLDGVPKVDEANVPLAADEQTRVQFRLGHYGYSPSPVDMYFRNAEVREGAPPVPPDPQLPPETKPGSTQAVTIPWDGKRWVSPVALQRHLAKHGIKWRRFIIRHPAIRVHLPGVRWDKTHLFYRRDLREHLGLDRAQWKRWKALHPAAMHGFRRFV